MKIDLKPEIESWLKAQVERGRFASIGEAIEALALEDQITQAEIEGADLAWARSYVEKGLADIEAGRTIPAEKVHDALRARFSASRGS